MPGRASIGFSCAAPAARAMLSGIPARSALRQSSIIRNELLRVRVEERNFATHERDNNVKQNGRVAKNKVDSNEVFLLGGSVHEHRQDALSIDELPQGRRF